MGVKTANKPPKTQGCILDSINRNQNGDYYIIFRLPKVARGMHGKNKGHVDELLIVGVNQKYIDSYLRAHYTNEGRKLKVEDQEED